MKQAKRLTSVLLVLATLFLLAAPTAVCAKSGLPAVRGLTVSTDGEAKQLVLDWDAMDEAFGYEIYRSTTGKTGSYKRIDVVGNPPFTDSDLKNATTYYYAVRPWAWNNAKETLFGPFRKVHLSTKITKSFALKRFQATWKTMDKLWSSIQHPEDYIADSKSDAIYYPITFKGYTTKAALKKYLQKFFTKQTANAIVNQNFTEIGGKLYAVTHMVMDPQEGLRSSKYLILSSISVKRLKCDDRKATISAELPYLILTGPGPFDDAYETVREKLTLSYENGRWVFSQSKWNFWWEWMFQYVE